MKTNRNVTLDVAKGLVLLSLPVIHSTLFYATSVVQSSSLGKLLAFIAENAAPVFMVTMGIAILISKRKSPRQIIGRSIKLMLLGYCLNFLKFILPMLWNGIPDVLLSENGITIDLQGMLKLFLMNDILQLASISYLICAFITRLRSYPIWAGAALILTICISPFIWGIEPDKLVFNQIVALFNGEPPSTFFPVFPWLVYPLTGIVIGYFIKTTPPKKLYGALFISGTLLVFLSLTFAKLEPMSWENNFYRLGPSGTGFHIGIALLTLCFCQIIQRFLRPKQIFKMLTLLSRNVTVVYIFQWILVCWLLPIFGYRQCNLFVTILASLITTLLTIFATFLYQKAKSGIHPLKTSLQSEEPKHFSSF